MGNYVGRFAPSPSGPLHAGSLVAALASYLDAKAHSGSWLVRMEDVDEARTVPGAAEGILETLRALGMHWDGEVMVQSARKEAYRAAFERLAGHTYPCGCSRKEIADSRLTRELGFAPDGSAIYPGTCRQGLAAGKVERALRVRVPELNEKDEHICFTDRWQGELCQHLASEAGDFVLFRGDGFWAYQLAVVVDDADQGVTHVVRGVDIIDSTARQIYLQRLLGVPTPAYLHVPVVVNPTGEKLSKQTGAVAIDASTPLVALQQAAGFLGLDTDSAETEADFWALAVMRWRARFLG